MSLVANLPPLNEKRGSAAMPSRAGVWTSENVNLDALADSFDIPDQDVRSQDLKSIPDVWAQFQVFNSAFAAQNHPMYREAKTQWRALLALFALALEYGDVYEIDLRPLHIPVKPDEQKELFFWVLRYLLPLTSIDPSRGDWTAPVLLIVREKRGGSGRFTLTGEDQLIGVLNPVTLVAPGKSAATIKLGTLPWLTDGLNDPLEGRILKGRDYQIIGEYCISLLNSLKQDTRQTTPQSRKAFTALVRELQSYAEECLDIVGPNQSHLTSASLSSPPDLPALYVPLLEVRVVDEKRYDLQESAGQSQLAMRDDLAFTAGASPFKGVVLIDPQLSETLQQDARDIRVWKHRTLSDVASQSVFDIVVAEAGAEGYLVVRPEDFFTDELVHLEDGSDIRGHAGSGFESTVLPLSPLSLLLEVPEQLIQNVKLTPSGGREHKVTLSVAISGSDRRHTLTRVYRADATAAQRFVEKVERPLGFAVWPDFYHPSWRWNFLRFQQNPSSTDLQMRFGISGPQLARDIGTLQSSAERARKMMEWLDAKRCISESSLFAARVTPEQPNQPYPPLQRLRFASATDNVGEIQISANGFEAICLARRPEKGATTRPVGLVLLGRKRKSSNGGAGRVVAVDFGTTNTVASFDGKNSVVFQDRVLFPITNASEDRDKRDRALVRWSFAFFMPLFDHETPIPTVAVLRPIDNSTGDAGLRRVLDGDDDRPLFSDCIFFVPVDVDNVARLTETLRRDTMLTSQLKFGLKWSSDPLTRKIARRFIRQAMIMISAELIDNDVDPERVIWRFSYPEAMNKIAKTSLTQAIRDSWKEVFYLPSGRPNTNEAAEAAVEALVTEGGAAANFFLSGSNDLNAGPLAIILDIGGGTTEVAIWSRGTDLRWRGSFRLAGGDFFTHYLVNNPRFFEMIDLADLAIKDGRSKLTVRGETSSGVSKDMVELTLNDRRVPVQFARRYPNIVDTPVGAGLRHCASVALGGMAFYLAEVVKKLVADGEVPQDDLKNVSFALGGRGSQFFRQMAGSPNADDSPLHDILRIFQDALALSPQESSLRILFSPKPKLEVVLGMYGDSKILARVQTKPDSHWLPMGEAIELKRAGGSTLTPSSTPVEQALDATVASYPKLDELKRFLALHEKHTGIKIDLNTSRGTSGTDFVSEYVFSRFSDILKDARDSGGVDDPTTQMIEPPFIMALRALIDLLGQNEESRSRFLKVSERH